VATSILITGAGGLIGTWFSRRLEQESVSAVSVGRADTNLLNPGAPTAMIENLRPEAVVHLAWSASGDPDYRRSDDNARWVDATIELHEICRKHDVRLWATGTGVEQHDAAVDAYTRSKKELRRHLAEEIDQGTVGWLRPYYVFDQVAGRPALFADARRARERGEKLILRDPDSEHDFVHAQDVAAALALAVQHDLMGELPIGFGDTHRVSDCADALGVQWTSARTTSAESTHAHETAKVGRLTALGWSPITTQEFFAHG
jgi:nucleoside-diphosphate-sugar epimerase